MLLGVFHGTTPYSPFCGIRQSSGLRLIKVPMLLDGKLALLAGWRKRSSSFLALNPEQGGLTCRSLPRGEQVFLCLLTSEWDARFEATLKSYFDNNPACTDRRISLGKCFGGWVLWGFFFGKMVTLVA